MTLLPELVFQLFSVTANLALFIFLIYYIARLRAREKSLERKEEKVDSHYHEVVDDALTKERKIMEDAVQESNEIIADAASEASEILTGAQYVSDSSKKTVDDALKNVSVDIKKEAEQTARDFTKSYQTSLTQLTNESLSDFQHITKELQTDLQKKLSEFHSTLLPALEKELEEYKKTRIRLIEESVTRIVTDASQEIMNKSISLEDHQKLVIDSLEKAKKEGVFG